MMWDWPSKEVEMIIQGGKRIHTLSRKVGVTPS